MVVVNLVGGMLGLFWGVRDFGPLGKGLVLVRGMVIHVNADSNAPHPPVELLGLF